MVGDHLQTHQLGFYLQLVLYHDDAQIDRRGQQLLALLVLDFLEVAAALFFGEDQQRVRSWLVRVNDHAIWLGLNDKEEWLFLDDYSLIFALKIYDLVIDLDQRFLAFPPSHFFAPPDEGVELELLVEDVVGAIEVSGLGDFTDHVFPVVEAKSL